MTSQKEELLHSSVGMATGYGLNGRGSNSGRGKRSGSTLQRPDRLWGHPASYPTGTGV
jgi:hypothetical protein